MTTNTPSVTAEQAREELLPSDLQFICSDYWQCWYVDGHVSLDAFNSLVATEVCDVSKFPAAAHGWLRSTDIPDDEDADAWFEPCEAADLGAFPITMIARNW